MLLMMSEPHDIKEAHPMKTCKTALRLLTTTFVLLFPASITFASYGIYVGKNLTLDSSMFLPDTATNPRVTG